MIKKSGYLWKYYGFTMTHMWGLHLVSGAMAVVGIGMLTFALLGITSLDQGIFYRLLASSAAIMLADIAMILYSIFAIQFYRFAAEDQQQAEQASGCDGEKPGS